jgi:hypothetical protein
MRERARVRGQSWISMALLPPHPAFGHLLPQGEGIRSTVDILPKMIYQFKCKRKRNRKNNSKH